MCQGAPATWSHVPAQGCVPEPSAHPNTQRCRVCSVSQVSVCEVGSAPGTRGPSQGVSHFFATCSAPSPSRTGPGKPSTSQFFLYFVGTVG